MQSGREYGKIKPIPETDSQEKEPMKILITTDLFTTQTNGVVRSVKNLRRELIALGHEVRILTLSEGSYSYRLGNVYYIRSLPLGAVYPDVRMPTSFRHKLMRQLIAWRPDVIHSQCEFFSFQFAHYISKRTGAPIVHTYHTLYEQYVGYVMPVKELGDVTVSNLSRLRLKRVRRIIAPTRKVEETLRGYGLTAPISVVPSGIKLEQHKFRFSAAERCRKRQALGIGENDRVLVNIGRLGYEKNLQELVRFFAPVCRDNPHLFFLIVGDGPAREKLQKLAQELGVENRVIFTGMVPPAQVQHYYQLGDIFVSASTSETQGLTYIEAAANGLPLLCRKDPCLDGVLLPGENGYDYTDEAQFRTALETMLGQDDWRTEAGKCSEQVAAGYSIQNFGRNVEKIYQEVIGQRSAMEET